jgi:hypothetical protein
MAADRDGRFVHKSLVDTLLLTQDYNNALLH